ncbi:MAG: DUF1127 domain-containing protein [Salaquimonas sp.]|jgi:uncharacterized protein YjiS (DUF1127 family)|nr:DUF1127 domain-containing protein [Salaquimonas sp.]
MNVISATTANAGIGTRRMRKSPIRAFWIRFQGYRRRQRDYRHLLSLPDYLLADIGLNRSQIVRRRRPFRGTALPFAMLPSGKTARTGKRTRAPVK